MKSLSAINVTTSRCHSSKGGSPPSSDDDGDGKSKGPPPPPPGRGRGFAYQGNINRNPSFQSYDNRSFGPGRGRGDGNFGRGRGGRGFGPGRGLGRGFGRGPGRGSVSGPGRGFGRGRGSALDRFTGQRNQQSKQNFAKTYFEPASQGVLTKKHDSGIPKLLLRPHKSSKLHDDGDASQTAVRSQKPHPSRTQGKANISEMLKNMGPVEQTDEFSSSHRQRGRKRDHDDTPIKMTPKLKRQQELVQQLMREKIQEPHYDSEDEYDPPKEKDKILEILEATKQAPKKRRSIYDDDDAGDMTIENLIGFDPRSYVYPDEVRNTLWPLSKAGFKDGTFEEFQTAMEVHPSRFASIERINNHPDSERHGKVHFFRRQPPPEFVEAHARFIHVTGIPHAVFDGAPGTLEEPLHAIDGVSKVVAEAMSVPVESVCPASMTSAYVGFADRDEFWDFYKTKSSARSTFTVEMKDAPTLSAFDHDTMDDSIPEEWKAKSTKEKLPILKLQLSRADWTPEMVQRHVLSRESEAGKYCGPIVDVHPINEATFLLLMESQQQVEAVLESNVVKAHLERDFRTCELQYVRAKREVLFDRFYGPNKCLNKYKQGHRLVVNGDVPPPEFLRSHACVLQLRHVLPTTTKEDLTDFFQQFCSRPRDLHGSIEFVTCAQGRRRDVAYVGFDCLEEANAVLQSSSGNLRLPSHTRNVKVRRVKEMITPDKDQATRNILRPLREVRPKRSTKELLASLQNWQDYVDPEDLEEIKRLGYGTETLEDTFRVLRFQNYTYSALDQSMTQERFNDSEKDYLKRGQHLRATMKEYVTILKDCVATVEDPGEMYELMFEDGQELTTEVDMAEEEERIQKLRERRLAGG